MQRIGVGDLKSAAINFRKGEIYSSLLSLSRHEICVRITGAG